MIVIIGATGNVGRPLVHTLADNGCAVTAMSRIDPGGLPAGAVHFSADPTEPESLRPGFSGAQAVYLLLPDGGNRLSPRGIVEAMVAAGVRRVVLQSSQAAGTRPELPAYDGIREFERAVQDSAVDWTILRPGGFSSNVLQWAAPIRARRAVVAPFADVGLPIVDPVDIAAMAAATLTSDGHAGSIYSVTGPAAITPRQQVRAIGDALGEPVTFAEQSRAEARTAMVQFMPEQIADSTLAIIGTPTPEEQRPAPDLERVLGRPAASFDSWVAGNLQAFR